MEYSAFASIVAYAKISNLFLVVSHRWIGFIHEKGTINKDKSFPTGSCAASSGVFDPFNRLRLPRGAFQIVIARRNKVPTWQSLPFPLRPSQ